MNCYYVDDVLLSRSLESIKGFIRGLATDFLKIKLAVPNLFVLKNHDTHKIDPRSPWYVNV